MNKVTFWLLAIFLFSAVAIGEAQQSKKVPRIGYLTSAAAAIALPNSEAFREGLRQLGYVEDKNIIVAPMTTLEIPALSLFQKRVICSFSLVHAHHRIRRPRRTTRSFTSNS